MAKKNKNVLKKIEKKMLEARKVLMNHGIIVSVAAGIAEAKGLFGVKAGELVQISLKLKEDEVGGLQTAYAIAFNLKKKTVGLILLSTSTKIMYGSTVSRTQRLMALRLNEKVRGTVINPLGQNLLRGEESEELSFAKDGKVLLLEAKAPGIMDRQPISEPLLTGLTVVDGLVPIGRGQRELIIGDRQTGKTTLALDTILNQTTVVCVYVSIGQKLAGIAQLYSRLQKSRKTRNLVIVCATASEPAPLQYLAPYAGCTVAEYFRDFHSEATLVVYDDLTKHAAAYRQISLLLRRSPGREAFPGDVFYLHSRLLERAAKLAGHKGGGSLTALPIVETQAGDVSAYIPTNVISITDGQIFLDVELFSEGIRPAVNVGLSVSRVGTAAQCLSMKALSGNVKLELAQYREVLGYVKFGGDLDPATAKLLVRERD